MFELTEPQRMIEHALRQWCERELKPKVQELEEECEKENPQQLLELMRKFANDFGMREMTIAQLKKVIQKKRDAEAKGEEFKVKGGIMGGERDPMIGMIFGKELARVSPSFGLTVAVSLGLCGGTILARGTADQIERYAVPVLTFEKLGCWGMTEPEAGSDAFATKTTAHPEGDFYIINGSKTFTTNAPFADIFVIYARIDRGEETRKDKRYVFPFVIERGTPGLSTSPPFKKMGFRGSPTGAVYLDDVKVHKNQLLGKEEKTAREQAKEVFAGERYGTPAMAWGIIEKCLEDCIEYSMQRKQFGHSIAQFQLIQEKIAKMYVHYLNVKNLAFQQAWAAREGKLSLEDACAAKYYCAQAAVEVALEAIQLMGGYGYMQEYHVEMLMRDAKMLSIGGGTNEIQLLNIAKQLFRKKGYDISLSGPAD